MFISLGGFSQELRVELHLIWLYKVIQKSRLKKKEENFRLCQTIVLGT